jgi:ATP-dependent RNA helicase DbpA
VSALSFSRLDLPAAQLRNLESLGYLAMTPVQAEALPIALQGLDLLAQAATGSGKTAAFAIPLLRKLDLRETAAQALVLCPTRELSLQVAQELRKLARYLGNVKVVALYGGQAVALQKAALRNGAHILVGTPGRILDHLARETLALGTVRTLVLDEADRMLEMGFLGDIAGIVSALPRERQTLLFSATFPEDIRVLSDRFQRQPAHVRVEPGPGDSRIAQSFILCEKEGKLAAVASLLSARQPESAIVFCNTKDAAKEAYRHLSGLGFSAAALHGDLDQREREQTLMRFRHGSCRVLVATDVAARGLDIENLGAVINLEMPHDMETYVHRIGRTGRAGNAGYAITLALPSEGHKLEAARLFLGIEIPSGPLEWDEADAREPLVSDRASLCVAAGRKDKLRAGDILGALTGPDGLEGKSVGKIDVTDYEAYVTVESRYARKALARLAENKIKGRRYKVRLLGQP